jgi:hypothetical protein
MHGESGGHTDIAFTLDASGPALDDRDASRRGDRLRHSSSVRVRPPNPWRAAIASTNRHHNPGGTASTDSGEIHLTQGDSFLPSDRNPLRPCGNTNRRTVADERFHISTVTAEQRRRAAGADSERPMGRWSRTGDGRWSDSRPFSWDRSLRGRARTAASSGPTVHRHAEGAAAGAAGDEHPAYPGATSRLWRSTPTRGMRTRSSRCSTRRPRRGSW